VPAPRACRIVWAAPPVHAESRPDRASQRAARKPHERALQP
jgi:hypothetical protein